MSSGESLAGPRASLGGGGDGKAAQRANLAGLLFCFLAIISICLTLFNLYLFVWIWSSLGSSSSSSSSGTSGTNSNASPRVQQAQELASSSSPLNLFEQLELLRDEHKLAFADKLLARKSIEVQKVKQLHAHATLRLSSASELLIKASGERAPPALVVSARRNSLAFPGGLIVRSDTRRTEQPALECKSSMKGNGSDRGQPFCHLRARQLELGQAAGVDFGALKTIQTSHVRTRRLHSALNKLQLMAGGANSLLKFESRHEQVHLRALDLVTLGSRNATVIIKAKTIELGDLAAVASERQLAKQHKLCVCLREAETNHQSADDKERQQQQQHADWDPPRSNNGRVFSIPSHLRCSQFTKSLCAPTLPTT